MELVWTDTASVIGFGMEQHVIWLGVLICVTFQNSMESVTL